MGKQKSSGWLDKYAYDGNLDPFGLTTVKKDKVVIPKVLDSQELKRIEANRKDKFNEEVAKRKTYINKPGTSASPAMKQAMEDIAAQEQRQKMYDDVANKAQYIGGGLELIAPITGPASPYLEGAGTLLSMAGSSYLGGRDALQGNYGSALLNAGLTGLGLAAYRPFANAANIPADAAKVAGVTDYIADAGQVANTTNDVLQEAAGVSRNVHQKYGRPISDYQPTQHIEFAKRALGNDFTKFSDKELKEIYNKAVDELRPDLISQGDFNAREAVDQAMLLNMRLRVADRLPQYTINDYIAPEHSFMKSGNYDLRGVASKQFYDTEGYDLSKLTPEERALMGAYTESYYPYFNNRVSATGKLPENLINHFTTLSDRLNDAILKNKINKETVVNRTVNNYDVNLIDPNTNSFLGKKRRSELQVGDIYKDNEFLSTSLPTSFYNMDHQNEYKFLDNIILPGGRMQSYAFPNATSYSKFPNESEILLPKGLIRRVENTTGPSEITTSILNPYKNGGELDKYQYSGTVAKKDAVTVQQPAKVRLKTKEEIARDAEIEKARLAAEAAKRQTYISADNISPSQRAAVKKARERQDMINNSQLAQTFGSLTPTGYNPTAGGVAANQFMYTTPAIAAGAVAGPAILPYIGAAMEAPIAGVAGLTANNLLNAGFAYEAANNIPNVAQSVKKAFKDPTSGNIADASLETGYTALGALPFVASALPGVRSTLGEVASALRRTPTVKLAPMGPYQKPSHIIDDLSNTNIGKDFTGSIDEYLKAHPELAEQYKLPIYEPGSGSGLFPTGYKTSKEFKKLIYDKNLSHLYQRNKLMHGCGSDAECAKIANSIASSVSRQILPGEAYNYSANADNAWYTTYQMLKNEGELVYNEGVHGPLNSDILKNVQVGDQVMFGPDAFLEHPQQSPLTGNLKEPRVNHRATVMGMSPDGNNLLIGESFDGRLITLPIQNNVYYNAASNRGIRSIVRPQQFIGKSEEIAKRAILNDVNLNTGTIDFGVSPELQPYKDVYDKIKPTLIGNLGIHADELDQIFRHVLGIGIQESKMSGKMAKGLTKAKVLIQDKLREAGLTKPVKEVINAVKEYGNRKYVENPDLLDFPGKSKIQMEASKLAEKEGISFNEALESLYNTTYNRPKPFALSNTDPSVGTFRQKYLSKTAKRLGLTEGDLKIGKGGKNDFYNSAENELTAAIANFYDLKNSLAKKHPDWSDQKLYDMATLSWNSPSKANNQELVDYFYEFKDNPKFEGFDYLNKVKSNIKQHAPINSITPTTEIQLTKPFLQFKEGGWLDKYDDGGDMNANHYSVSAPEGYLGDGTFNQGRDYSPAWGGQFENGGPVKRFMQPTETFKNIGYNPLENGLSTEYSTSIGAPGEIYLVPGYRQGRVLNDPEGVFNTYGEHLGGPFKTVQSAEDFAKLRHKYVEQNKNIPAPFKTRDYAMGGSLPGAVGHMYAREGAPRNFGGKMTVPSAADGIELNETEPVKQPSTKPEDRTKQEENYMNRAPLDIIEEGRSKFRFNMLKDAVRHQMADEYLIPLDKVNDKELTDRAKKLLLARENKLANPTVEFVKGKGATNVDGVLGYYDPSNKGALISLSDNLNDYDIDEFGRTVRHEFRHAYDDAGTLLTHYENELIKNKTAPGEADKIKTIGQGEYNYLSRPTEVTARLQEIRGSLKDNPLMLGYLKKEKDSPISLYDKVDKEGYYIDDFTGKRVPIQRTYDPKKDKATIEHLKSLKNHSGYEELLKVMKPEDIVELLNTIAANNPQQGLPMAQNGMQFYQNGLDFKPKSISKNGSVIEDDRGQWAHPGKVTKIGSNKITMKGVPYPVLGISDTGDMQMMYPNQEYQYIGDSVTEYPMMKQGGQLTKLDQLTNFTNYNTKQPGGWLDKYQD